MPDDPKSPNALMQPMKRAFKALVASVCDPLARAALDLPWLGRCSVVLAIMVLAGFFKFHARIATWTSFTRDAVRIASCTRARIELSTSTRAALKHRVADLTQAMYSSLDQEGVFANQAWTTAQIIVAVGSKRKIDPRKATSYFRSEQDPVSHGWQKFPKALYPPHIGASSWVLLAMAHLKVAATPEEIRFLLRNQDRSKGWWPIYPVAQTNVNNPLTSTYTLANASTYATAMAVWALHEQLTVAHVADVDHAIADAIHKGMMWLYNTRSSSALSRWKDYPSGREMLPVSGLALHVLHVVGDYDTCGIDRLWLRELPGSIPGAKQYEMSGRTISSASGPVQTDDVRYYTLASCITATIDAYANGDFIERGFALSWLQRAISIPGCLDELTGYDDNWITAETVIALTPLL